MDNLDRDLFPSTVLPPRRIFMYTLEQIASMLQVQRSMLEGFCWWQGRSPTRFFPSHIRCINIALPDDPPEWRVEEEDFYAWCRYKGIRVDRHTTPRRR